MVSVKILGGVAIVLLTNAVGAASWSGAHAGGCVRVGDRAAAREVAARAANDACPLGTFTYDGVAITVPYTGSGTP